MLKKILVAAVMVMCGCVLNAQTITPKSTLKGWFITGAKPTQEQFWNWMDSYWHKDETIPVSNVSGLPDFMSYVFVRNDTLYGVKSDTAFFIAVINSDNVTVDSNNVKYNLLDTASQPHDDVVNGNKYLILNPPQYLGDGITINEFYAHKNNIATYTGGIYNYVIADTGDIVSVANPTTTFYKYSGNAWQLIRRSATIGGDNINAMVDIGARGDTAMRLIAGGKAWVRVGKHGNVHLLVFKNAVPRNNVLKIVDTTTGQIGWDTTADLSVVAPLYWMDSAHSILALDTTGLGGGGGGGSVSAGDTIVLNVHTNAYNDGRYYPLSGNPSGYLTSYSETDPLALKMANNLSDLVSASTARTNLGLGTFATLNNPATSNGDLLYYNGSSFSRLGIGSTNQILAVSAGVPAWKPVSLIFDTTYNWNWTGTHTWIKGNGTTRDQLLLLDTLPVTTWSARNSPSILFGAHNYQNITDTKSYGRFGYLGFDGSGGVWDRFYWKLGTDTSIANFAIAMTLDNGGYLTLGNGGDGNVQGLLSAHNINTSNIKTAIAAATLYLQNGRSYPQNFGADAFGINILGGSGTITKTTDKFTGIAMQLNYNEVSSTTENRDLWIKRYEQSVSSGVNNFIDVGISSAINGGGTYTSKFSITNKGVLNVIRPIAFTSTTPSYTLGTGAGTGASCTITGSDAAGYISITTGTTPTAGGDVVTISFSSTLTNTPTSVQLTAAGENAAVDYNKVFVDQSSSSTSSVLIKNISTTALQASTTYKFYYTITQ